MHVDEARHIPSPPATATSPVAVTPGSSPPSPQLSSNGTSKSTKTMITPLKRRMDVECRLVQLDDDDDDDDDEQEDHDEELVGYNDDDDGNQDRRGDLPCGPDVIVPLGQPLSSFVVDMIEDDCFCPVTPSSPIGCSSNKFLKTSTRGRRKVRNAPRRKDRTFAATTTATSVHSSMTVSARRFDAAQLRKVEGMMMAANIGNGSPSSRLPRPSIPRSFQTTTTGRDADRMDDGIDMPLPGMPPCPPSEDIARISSELYELCLFRNYRSIVSQSSSSSSSDGGDDDTDDDDDNVPVLYFC